MGVIRLPSLFELLERHPKEVIKPSPAAHTAYLLRTGRVASHVSRTLIWQVIALDGAIIEQVVYDAIRMKAEVVALDEKEAGLRGTLNWGHTIGHAIEAIKSPGMMHGECVAVGCVAEAVLASRLGDPEIDASALTAEKIERITACFESYGLPIHVPRAHHRGVELCSPPNPNPNPDLNPNPDPDHRGVELCSPPHEAPAPAANPSPRPNPDPARRDGGGRPDAQDGAGQEEPRHLHPVHHRHRHRRLGDAAAAGAQDAHRGRHGRVDGGGRGASRVGAARGQPRSRSRGGADGADVGVRPRGTTTLHEGHAHT